MLETTPDVDRLILLSGDGDFDILLQKIKTKGKKVDVYGVPKLTADSLVQAASTFHAIDKKLLLKY